MSPFHVALKRGGIDTIDDVDIWKNIITEFINAFDYTDMLMIKLITMGTDWTVSLNCIIWNIHCVYKGGTFESSHITFHQKLLYFVNVDLTQARTTHQLHHVQDAFDYRNVASGELML